MAGSTLRSLGRNFGTVTSFREKLPRVISHGARLPIGGTMFNASSRHLCKVMWLSYHLPHTTKR